jgi:hypothetical protein
MNKTITVILAALLIGCGKESGPTTISIVETIANASFMNGYNLGYIAATGGATKDEEAMLISAYKSNRIDIIRAWALTNHPASRTP